MATGRRVYLDTNALIGILEKADRLDEAQDRLVGKINDGGLEAVTSELALAECLVKPIANRDEALVQDYMWLLAADSKFLQVKPVTRDVILEAARVRAGAGIKLPDAIHVATANLADCDAFVSNDKRLAAATAMTFKLWSELGKP